MAAAHHAETVAHRVGEPFGTLVLALSITAIELALMLSMMFSRGVEKASLARDTIHAPVMIISSGVIGLCVLLGGWRHREPSFRLEGAGPALAALTALATLLLVMPVFTRSAPGASYSNSQLAFVGASSLALSCCFVFFQTVRHRDCFLPADNPSDEAGRDLRRVPVPVDRAVRQAPGLQGRTAGRRRFRSPVRTRRLRLRCR